MATKVDNYFEKLKIWFGGELPKPVPVFFGMKREKSGFIRQAMGQNYQSQIGKDVAEFLGQENTSEYKGEKLWYFSCFFKYSTIASYVTPWEAGGEPVKAVERHRFRPRPRSQTSFYAVIRTCTRAFQQLRLIYKTGYCFA